ncbi:MAG: DUF3047 domain-containing protein [Candidatus Manganitrophaceae bacterium]|nr:MAG: DUF3047 domain-containing protein [Candidatus Manganitrophaceae bacterium]
MTSKRRFFFFFLLLIIVVSALRLMGLQDALDQERLRSGIERWGAWGPLLYILIFAIAPVLFLPGLPITLAAGLAFGPLWGTVYASIGSTLGAGLAFLVARYFARDAVLDMLGERWRWIEEGVSKRGWVFVAITRFVPIFPYIFLNYAFGLTRIRFATYLFTSWLFMLPVTAAYVIFSSSVLNLIKGEVSPAFLVGLALLITVSLIPLIYRRWKGSKDSLPKVIVWATLLLLPLLPGRPAPAEERIDLLMSQRGERGLPEGWRPLTFPRISRHTEYEWIEEEGRPVIRAVSRQSASALIHPLDLDVHQYDSLSWCWKIDRIISKGKETEKKGDDYAARLYVTFRFDPDKASLWERTKFGFLKQIYGEYPPKGAINYIWANRLPKGEAIPNAYTGRAMMVAVESGADRVGQWVCQARSLYADYKWLFKEEPPPLSGIAVMTDTDDTGEEAVAFYRDLVLKAK